jgi:CheY-like chemotaxis protein
MESVDVLLIDDNPGDVELVERIFDERDLPGELHDVRTGEDGLDWLHGRGEFADAPRPDLVLLDLNLPVIDGLAVLEEVESDQALGKLPVLVLTGSRSDDDLVDAYCAGASACLRKPVDPDAFGDLVESTVEYWAETVALPPIPEDETPRTA